MANFTLYDLLDLQAQPPVYGVPDLTGNTTLNTNGRTRLWVNNTNTGGTQTVTIITQSESNFGTYPDYTFTVLTNGFTVLPPFSPERFNNGSGQIVFDVSTTSNILIAAVEDSVVLKGTGA